MIFNILQKTITKRNISKLSKIINKSFISTLPCVNNYNYNNNYSILSLNSYYNNSLQFYTNKLQIVRNSCGTSKNNNDNNDKIANSNGNIGEREIEIETETGYDLVLRRASNILINVAERSMSKVLHIHCETSMFINYIYYLFQI